MLPQPLFCVGPCPQAGLSEDVQGQAFAADVLEIPTWAEACFGLPAPLSPLNSWGVAQIEQEYSEDLVRTVQADGTQTSTVLPVRFVPRAYGAVPHQVPVFADLTALLSYFRQHFTVDSLVLWGQCESGYFPMALYALHLSGEFKAHFVPVYDLQAAQPYRHLSAQLLEAAATEWALRALPESVSDGLDDPRPLVMLGAQPYFQVAISTLLLQGQKVNESALADEKTRAVWETFLIPHQDLSGYVKQWQEILYRSLPVFCQASHGLARQAQKLDQRDLLTPCFQRRVTLQGHIQQDSEGLRECAQLIQARQETRMTPQQLLRVPEMQRRWQLFLNDHGHWGSLDLSQPRLHEQATEFVQSLLCAWHTGHLQEDLTLAQRLGARLSWKTFQSLYDARENFWSNALWALDQVKRRIQEKVVDDAFWDYPPELLAASEMPPPAIAQDQSVAVALVFPEPEHAELKGVGLKTGMAKGRLWCPNVGQAAQLALPEGWTPQDTLLCLPRLQVQHWPWVAQVAGVILTEGHVFDQGSHLLREWNKPAIVQVGQHGLLTEGRWVRIDSAQGNLYIEA